MSKLLSEVRSAVRSYLDESAAADWTDPELNRYINQRYHRVYSNIVNVYEDYYLTKDAFDTVAAQQECTSTEGVPTDIFKIRRIEINYDVSNSNSNPRRAFPLKDLDAEFGDLGQANQGVKIFTNPNYYTFGHGSATKIGFIPIPDKTGTDAVSIWYIKQISDLTSDATSLDIPYADRFYHIIVEGAVGDALRQGQQDSTEADKMDAKFDRGLLLMQQELEDKTAEGTKSVIDIQGEDLNFQI